MATTIEALTKLAEDLTNRVDELSSENDSLKKALDEQKDLNKKAAEQTVVQHASESIVDETLDKLIKIGALTEEQRAESRKTLLTDADAPYRVLQRFIDAQNQVKSAADASDKDNISGGQLVGSDKDTQQPSDNEVLDRMMQILHI